MENIASIEIYKLRRLEVHQELQALALQHNTTVMQLVTEAYLTKFKLPHHEHALTLSRRIAQLAEMQLKAAKKW